MTTEQYLLLNTAYGIESGSKRVETWYKDEHCHNCERAASGAGRNKTGLIPGLVKLTLHKD